MSVTGRHVMLGVSGGIACYKSCTLARRLTELGITVDVVMTAAASEFVRPLTFEGLTGRPVLTSLWERGRALAHIGLAKAPDLAIVDPATAQLLARAAMGMADDLLTALLLARTGPVLVAPAMNDAMYAQPATQANLRALAARGWVVVGPEVGALAEGPSERAGRMSEPEGSSRRRSACSAPIRGGRGARSWSARDPRASTWIPSVSSPTRPVVGWATRWRKPRGTEARRSSW
jgi:phosphopantothenoylcysteine decarboxylase/phosphopantothenate--cysteine ligase